MLVPLQDLLTLSSRSMNKFNGIKQAIFLLWFVSWGHQPEMTHRRNVATVVWWVWFYPLKTAGRPRTCWQQRAPDTTAGGNSSGHRHSWQQVGEGRPSAAHGQPLPCPHHLSVATSLNELFKKFHLHIAIMRNRPHGNARAGAAGGAGCSSSPAGLSGSWTSLKSLEQGSPCLLCSSLPRTRL